MMTPERGSESFKKVNGWRFSLFMKETSKDHVKKFHIAVVVHSFCGKEKQNPTQWSFTSNLWPFLSMKWTLATLEQEYTCLCNWVSPQKTSTQCRIIQWNYCRVRHLFYLAFLMDFLFLNKAVSWRPEILSLVIK